MQRAKRDMGVIFCKQERESRGSDLLSVCAQRKAAERSSLSETDDPAEHPLHPQVRQGLSRHSPVNAFTIASTLPPFFIQLSNNPSSSPIRVD